MEPRALMIIVPRSKSFWNRMYNSGFVPVSAKKRECPPR